MEFATLCPYCQKKQMVEEDLQLIGTYRDVTCSECGEEFYIQQMKSIAQQQEEAKIMEKSHIIINPCFANIKPKHLPDWAKR